MADISKPAVQQLCLRLQIDPEFFEQCLQESVVKIHEIDGVFDLDNGTVLRLRQLERICTTLNVALPVALLLSELNGRIAELEEEIRLLRPPR